MNGNSTRCQMVHGTCAHLKMVQYIYDCNAKPEHIPQIFEIIYEF